MSSGSSAAAAAATNSSSSLGKSPSSVRSAVKSPQSTPKALPTVNYPNMNNEAPAPAPAPTSSFEPEVGDALDTIRNTAEYRAAWDLELWKGIQADRFAKQLEKQKLRANADLQRLMQSKSREQQQTLAQRAATLDTREERIKQVESQLLQRQQRIADMERDLRRTRQQLLDAQRRVEDEVRAQVRRANEDIAHKAKLLQERVLAAEQETKKAEERQRQSHNEYLQLYEAFNRFKVEQLTSKEEGLSSSKVFQDMQSQLQLIRAQHVEGQRLQIEKLEQKHSVELHELHTRIRKLEEQNKRLLTALARRREQVHQLRVEGDGTCKRTRVPRDGENEEGIKGRGDTANGLLSSANLSPEVLNSVQELHRLRRERVSLVDGSAGALSPSDLVVARVDKRIKELENQLFHILGNA